MSEQDYEPAKDDAPPKPRSRAVMVGALVFLALLVLVGGFHLWGSW
jgi:hypothetical protein